MKISRKDAISKGVKHYFTGAPCKRGHIAQRRVSSNDCVECSKLRQQSGTNKEKKAAHYQANKDRYKAAAKQNYYKNREKKLQYVAEYQKRNIRKVISYQTEYARQRREKDPLFDMVYRIRRSINSAFRTNGLRKTSKTAQILGCSFKEFKQHIERQFTDGMNWSNRDRWHIDHIIPISTATTKEEIIALNHHTNLRPLWAKDNLRKSNKREYLI